MNVNVECSSGCLSFPVFTQEYKNICIFYILLSQQLDTNYPAVKELTTYVKEKWTHCIHVRYKSNIEELIATCVFLRKQNITIACEGNFIKFYCNGKQIQKITIFHVV
jgi:hypothetical protein